MSDIELAAKITESSDNLIYATRMNNYELLYLNQKLMDILGLKKKEQYFGKRCYKLLQGRDSPCDFCTNASLKENESYQWKLYNPLLKKTLSVIDKRILYDGEPIRVEMAIDITEEVQQQESLKNKLTVEETLVRCIQTLTEYQEVEDAINRLLQVVADFYGGDRGYIFEFNYGLEILDNTYEWCREGTKAQKEQLQGVPLEAVSSWIEEFERGGEFYIKSLDEEVDKNSLQYKILQPQQIDSLITAPMVKDGTIVGFIGVDNPKVNTEDLTLIKSVTFFILDDVEKRELMKQLEHMSYYDILTQVYNRNKYTHVLRQKETKEADSVGILYMDLNGLKIANDTHGHDYGDHLIKQSARLLQSHFSDCVYRLGGDEFLVLCLNISKEEFERRVGIIRKETESNAELNVSVGSIWSKDLEHLEEQITLADELMYEEKRSYYKGNLLGHYSYRSNLARELMDSIKKGDFLVYLQPMVDVKTKKLMGAEALIRKKDERGDIILPENFLHLYEEERSIQYIDLFVFKKVCQTLHSWETMGCELIKISVNFSKVTLMEREIVKELLEVCRRYQVDPRYLDIEMPESIGHMKEAHLMQIVRDLKEAGFSISLDDFGAQFSNLASLKKLDFDRLKLDRTLVQGIDENERAKVILESAVSLCKQFEGAVSIAEGVESEGQMQVLLQSMCDVAQGYFISEPISIEAFSEKYFQ